MGFALHLPQILQRFLALLGVAMVLLVSSSVVAAPLISEFLADNETVNSDSDGDSSDWIELYNPDSVAVDISGYYLTDNSSDLTKWQIPATTIIEPTEFLLIFASDKDRAVAGSELHTNFKLSAAGEFLALVAPDGQTIVSGFSPAFPAQFPDASYGLEQIPNTFDETLVSANQACTAFAPTDGILGNSWTGLQFDDSTWKSGAQGVGYERTSGYEGVINLDVEADMYNQSSSIYIRIPFDALDLTRISGLDLEIQYDDGFAAYFNGSRVLTVNGPAVPVWDDVASGEHPDVDALDFQTFSLFGQRNLLQQGQNVLALHGLNTASSDEDLLIRARLVMTRIADYTMGSAAYFADPTPGQANAMQEELPTADVEISEPSKTFTTPFNVTLSSAFPEQVIRYTLDGSIPDLNSPEYVNPIPITNSTQLRTRVFDPNGAAGPIAMESYLRIDSQLEGFSSNLPIVILENWGGGDPGGTSFQDAFWAIIEPDEATNSRSEMLDPPQLAGRCGLKRRGSSSFNWPKYSMSVEARDEQLEDLGVKPLGMPRESDWVLSGRYQFDRALMRNDLIYELSNQAGEYAVRTRRVEVFHNVGGGDLTYADYFGVYSLMEKIKRDDDRVDIASLGPRDVRDPEITGGYIFKKDRADPGDIGFTVNGMGTLRWVEPKEEEVAPRQAAWLQSHLNELDAALNASDWTNPITGKHISEYIDEPSWVKHHWLNAIAMNVDAFRLSAFFYKHRSDTNDGKIGAGPVWDFDRTMGSYDGRDDNPNAWNGSGGSTTIDPDQINSSYPWWGQVLQNPDFRQAHTDLWQTLRRSTFSTSNIDGIILDFAAEIDNADPDGTNLPFPKSPALRNFAKWTQVPPSGGSYGNEVRNLRLWLRQHLSWLDSQFTPQPSFSPNDGASLPGLVAQGAQATFVVPSGTTVYYTTDGSDPRLPGGGVSSEASSVLPIPITDTTKIIARSFDSTPVDPLTSWSGPIEGTFLVGPIADSTNLAITEVHYAPLPPGNAGELAETDDASDFEFLELTNISPTDTIDLTDVHFEAGITFTFTGSAVTSLAPGERVLIVRNQNAFEARYGTSHSSRIAGEFAPSRLDNAGERIHLVNGLGDTIADFTYNDKVPWPADAGFTGYSMVLNSSALPSPNYMDPASWRSSSQLGGNPNASDSAPFAGNAGDDDDNDGLTKFFEHAAGTSDNDHTDGIQPFTIAFQDIEVADVVDTYLTVTYTRSLTADDVTILPEFSSDLQSWFGGPVFFPLISEINRGDGTSLVTRRIAFPHDVALNPKIYLRLKVTAQ